MHSSCRWSRLRLGNGRCKQHTLYLWLFVATLSLFLLLACSQASDSAITISEVADLGVSDSQLRAALDNETFTITTEDGSGVHEGTTFVLASWLGDELVAQWNLRNGKVTKVVVIVDPNVAIEPYLTRLQLNYLTDLADLILPGLGFDVSEWVITAWQSLSQQDDLLPSSTIYYHDVKAVASVHIDTNIGYIEFTRKENMEP